MDYRYTPEEEAFRQEFVSWIEKNLPKGYDPEKRDNFKTAEEHMAAYKAFQKSLFEGGYTAMHYPKEYGGQ